MSQITTDPEVSVIVPAYNAGAFIRETIQSVSDQTFRDFEIIVVDDGSTDDTRAQLESLSDRLRYIKQENAGSSVARNRGILAARGALIAFLDADDLWVPEKLEKQVNYLHAHPEVVLVYSDFSRTTTPEIDGESQLARYSHRVAGREFYSLLRQNFIHTSSVVLRREALASAGIFDSKLRNAQDWDLWVRLADVGAFGHIDEILSAYRVHDEQTVGTLQYARNLLQADSVVLARWDDDPEVVSCMNHRIGHDLWKLGRREWRHGNIRRSRAAYWRSAFYRENWGSSLARAAFLSLPSPLIRLIRRFRESRR